MKKIALILIIFAGMITPLFSLELKEGRMKVVLHSSSGRFSAYYLDDLNEEIYVPFVLDQDPRTSYFSLLLNNNIYHMGESILFPTKMEKGADSASFSWQNRQVKVTQDFSFIKSGGAALADGLRIDITVENLSESTINAGIRYLFDTHLGESENYHFSAGSKNLESEYDVQSDFPGHWISPTSLHSDIEGMQMMLKGYGITTPDRVLFANWKRISDSNWSYSSNASRNWNLLPYSLNDSAVAHYYNPVALASGEAYTITIVLGAFSPNGFSLDPSGVGDDLEGLLTGSGGLTGSNYGEQVRADLITITDLIEKIDEILAKGDNVSDDELKVLQEILERLKDRQDQQ